jgi:NTE family protein
MTRTANDSNCRWLFATLLFLTLSGCASWAPANAPLAQADPGYGYRPNLSGQFRDSGRVLITLAFSGGGTRAAAFAYGVLEELRDTEVTIAGERKRLVDEVDTISGVSGGSFPAAY